MESEKLPAPRQTGHCGIEMCAAVQCPCAAKCPLPPLWSTGPRRVLRVVKERCCVGPTPRTPAATTEELLHYAHALRNNDASRSIQKQPVTTCKQRPQPLFLMADFMTHFLLRVHG